MQKGPVTWEVKVKINWLSIMRQRTSKDTVEFVLCWASTAWTVTPSNSPHPGLSGKEGGKTVAAREDGGHQWSKSFKAIHD